MATVQPGTTSDTDAREQVAAFLAGIEYAHTKRGPERVAQRVANRRYKNHSLGDAFMTAVRATYMAMARLPQTA